MERVPGKARTYRVTAADFPIQVQVEAINLPDCRAEPSAVQVVQGGTIVATLDVTVTSEPAARLIRYAIVQPGQPPPLRLDQVIDCFFSAGGEDARYRFTLTSAGGAVQTTETFPPSIDPRSVLLRFLYE